MYGINFQSDSMYCRFIGYESEYAPIRDLILKKIVSIEMEIPNIYFQIPISSASWS